ncbi:MAG: YdeI/OmpD-associated family protein [Sphingomonas sp.]
MSGTPSITFTCTLADEGAIPIDFDQRTVFGQARPPVIVTLGGHSYRSTIAIMGGVTFVPLRKSNREAAGVVGGQTIEVTLTLDTAPRTVEVPEALAEALDVAGGRGGWDRLSYTAQREQAEAVESAKRPETRKKRIAAAVALAATRA